MSSQINKILAFYSIEDNLHDFRQLILMYIATMDKDALNESAKVLGDVVKIIEQEPDVRQHLLFAAAVLTCFVTIDSRKYAEQQKDNEFVSFKEIKNLVEGLGSDSE